MGIKNFCLLYFITFIIDALLSKVPTNENNRSYNLERPIHLIDSNIRAVVV